MGIEAPDPAGETKTDELSSLTQQLSLSSDTKELGTKSAAESSSASSWNHGDAGQKTMRGVHQQPSLTDRQRITRALKGRPYQR
jgi:hypothetical protein